MEDLTKSWRCLTLFDQEGFNLRLTEDEVVTKFVIAAKLLTKRALNADTVVKMFTPLWRSQNGFKVKKEGYHVMLFTFDNKIEMEKILLLEPWSFDKHLMLSQSYNKDTNLANMDFNMVTFWVQVHEILVRFRTRNVAEKICGAIGKVTRPAKDCEVDGDDL